MVSDTRKLRCLDLFSGIGGISVALQPWCETICYCEIDPYATGVLIKNMAEGNIDVAPIWSDVTTFGQSEIDQVGPIDIICGGFPCQDVSVAGKGAGLAGERSGLFFEIIRLIRLARPRFVFLENVSALLTRGLDTVLKELSESGYDAEWQVLGADDVGANHRRKRVWILADSQRKRWRGRGYGDAGGCDGTVQIARPRADNQPEIMAYANEQGVQIGNKGARGANGRNRRTKRFCSNVFDTESVRLEGQRPGREQESYAHEGQAVFMRNGEGSGPAHWATEPAVGRLANGLPFRVDRLKCLGNSVVPLCARTAFEMLINRKGFL